MAKDKDQIVGFLMVSAAYGGVSFGNWLVVCRNYQRQGIASKLLKIWEKEAKKWGCHKLHLLTEGRNVSFYQKRGFILLGLIPKNYFGADDFYFYKTIQEPKEENYLKAYLKKKKRK